MQYNPAHFGVLPQCACQTSRGYNSGDNSSGVQVQRLIAVLSVPGVSRRKVLEGSSLDPGPDLTDQERKQLKAAGWTPGTTIRSLLNFTGLSLSHNAV